MMVDERGVAAEAWPEVLCNVEVLVTAIYHSNWPPVLLAVCGKTDSFRTNDLATPKD